MTALLSGVVVAHKPVGTPGDHVRLALWDRAQTARTGIDFRCAPGRNLTDVPSAVKSFFVRIVGIKDGSVQLAHRSGSSAAFGVLVPTTLILASHDTHCHILAELSGCTMNP